MTDFERQDEINSLMGKLGATSKHNKALKEKVASLEHEMSVLRESSTIALHALGCFCDDERWNGTWQKHAYDKLESVLDNHP